MIFASTLIFAIVCFLPEFVFVFFAMDSISAGFILSCIIVLSILFCNKEGLHLPLKNIAYVFVFLLVLSFVGFIINGNPRSFTLLPLIFTYITAYNLACFYKFISISTARRSFFIGYILCLLFAVFSLIVKNPIESYTQLEKPVFPFSEPSHFALLFGCLSIGLYSGAGIKLKAFIVMSLLALIFLVKSAVLFCYLLLLVVIGLFARGLIYGVLASLVALPVLMGILINDEYYNSRILDSNNLSLLVYLQGWEFIKSFSTLNYGFGLGAQNLGMFRIDSFYFAELIHDLYGQYFNIYDGSFLASKLISEFGLFGILLLIYILFKVKQAFYRLVKNNRYPSYGYIPVFDAFIVGFTVELFIRGYGYFTPTVLFFIVSILYTNKSFKL